MLFVHDLGIELFIKEILSLPEIQDRIQHLMIESIESARTNNDNSNNISLETTKQVSELLMDLTSSAATLQQKIYQIQRTQIKYHNFYETIFEAKFLQLSSQYYLKLSQSWIRAKSTPEYLDSVDSVVTSETKICAVCMNQQTLPKLESTLFTAFIGRDNAAQTLVSNPQSGLSALMASRRYPELGVMRRLFDRVPSAHRLMCDSVKRYVASVGAKVTAAAPAYDAYTHELLAMREQARKFLAASFGEDVDFAQALDGGFECFMNDYAETPALLARYMHEMLVKGAKADAGSGSEVTASEVVALFRHIHDKDKFEACYRKYLAGRLLTGRSTSVEEEHKVLALFRAECGSQYTSKADGMFHDMQFSEDITAEFQSACASTGACPIKMNVSVLSSHLWSLKVPPDCALPKVVMDSCSLFEQFFTKKYDSRKFTWLHSLGIADVRAVITPTKVYSFLLSAHQLSILGNIFADDVSADVGLTVDRLAELTRLPRPDIRRCLTLFCKTRLLTCWRNDEKAELNPKLITPMLRINDSYDRFYVNKKFAYKSHRVNLATLKDSTATTASSSLSSGVTQSLSSSSSSSSLSLSSSLSGSLSSSVLGDSVDGNGGNDEDEDVSMNGVGVIDQSVEEERRLLVDSVIVRVMKARKVLNHSELIDEVIEVVKTRFMPNAKFLKNRIEHLIENEFVNNITHTYT